MIKKHKKFYEIDRYQIDQSLGELLAFFDIIKKFASKCHGHLKYLIYLVNNLIESDDYLELVDTTLHTSGPFKLSKNIYYSTRIEEEVRNNDKNYSPQNQLQQLYTSMQEEQDRLSQKLQDGQNQTQFIKSCLDRVFDKIEGIRNDTDVRKDKINIVNNIKCPNCNHQQNGSKIHNKNDEYDDQNDQQPNNPRISKKIIKSMYNVKRPTDLFDSIDSEIDNDNHPFQQQTIPMDDNKINKLENQIDDLKRILNQEKKKNRQLQVQNNDFREQLKDKDDSELEKDEEIEDLKANLKDLEDTLMQTQQQNKKLNKKLKKMKKQPNDISPNNNFSYAPDLKEKDKQIENLKKKNQALNNQINEMEDRIKVIEEKEEIIKQPFSSDLLKCLFSQVSYIDVLHQQLIQILIKKKYKIKIYQISKV